nr:hypothetical protein [Streptomyces sp. 11-1-2]
MHEAGHDVSLLARGERLTALRRQGVQLAEEDGPVRRVPGTGDRAPGRRVRPDHRLRPHPPGGCSAGITRWCPR